MPTPDWLNRSAAFSTAADVPCRLLQPVSSHGGGNASGGLGLFLMAEKWVGGLVVLAQVRHAVA